MTPSTTRVNFRKTTTSSVYIGRPSTGQDELHHFGNPFTHLKDLGKAQVRVKSRALAVKAYEDWLRGAAWTEIEPQRREWILKALPRLSGEVLGCFCDANQACHGDVLIQLVHEFFNGGIRYATAKTDDTPGNTYNQLRLF